MLFVAEYWEEGEYTVEFPPENLFLETAADIGSSFFTMDIGRKTDGEWIIVELGDAQVAGIPERSDLHEFCGALRSRLRER